MLKRFSHKPLVDPEDLRDEQGRLPAVGYVGTYEQFKRSAYFHWKQLANENTGFWNALTDYVARAALCAAYDNPERAAMYAMLLSIETKYLHHKDMSRGDRMKNVQFMAHAIARQRECNCLAVGILGKDCMQAPRLPTRNPMAAP